MATSPGTGDAADVDPADVPGAAGAAPPTDEGPGAGVRHREIVAELVRMRREEAAEEDDEELAWFSGVREEVLGAMALNTDPKPIVPTGC